MTQPFVDAEVDRTKSKWVANTFREFNRPRTTIRSLFYYAMQREEEDYPICGGFVGEIRVIRHYHESDGSRLAKWVGKAKLLGYIPDDSILEDLPGEHVFLFRPSNIQHEGEIASRPEDEKALCRTELWINKSSLNTFLLPVCAEKGVNLVSVSGRASADAVDALIKRANSTGHAPTQVLCLSDFNSSDFSFCDDLGEKISSRGGCEKIKIRRIGLTPQQVLDLKLPMYSEDKASGDENRDALGTASRDVSRNTSRDDRSRYKKHLKPYGLNPKHRTELDALEVYYPGGISGFISNELSKSLDDCPST